MSNEEHIEEMYYDAHRSGVISEFRKKIAKKLSKNEKKHVNDVVEEVYFKMKKKNIIQG
jgi:hypothetical protein